MWHQKASPSPSTTFYRSSGEYTASSSNEYSSSNTAFDSDTEKNGLHSPEGYNFGFTDNYDRHSGVGKKWRSPRLKRTVNRGRSHLRRFLCVEALQQGACYKFLLLLKLRLRSYLSKKVLCFLIITSALVVSIMQLYPPLAHYHPPSKWSYLVENRYDFVSDSKVLDLLEYLSENERLQEKYLFRQDYKDRRITPARYLRHLRSHVNKTGGIVSESLQYGFSWQDWVNFDERLLPNMDYLLLHNGLPISGCSQFETEIGFPPDNRFKRDSLPNCTDLIPTEISRLANPNYPHFRATAPLDNFQLPIEARIVHGATFLYHHQPPPQRLIFVDGLSKTDFIVPVVHKEQVFPTDNEDLNDLEPVAELMAQIVAELPPEGSDVYNRAVAADVARINRNGGSSLTLTLTADDFANPENLTEIEAALPGFAEAGTLDAVLHGQVAEQLAAHPDGDYPKYFHEPRLNDKRIGGSHYDWRFFNIKEVDNEYKRLSTLNRMIRAWLRFTNNEQLHTWLAHGTLLGYSFNGHMLPWDYDHDVQLSASAMWRLAREYNNTLVVDCTGNAAGLGHYLLEVSSNFFDRRHGNANGNNAIDARFIDVHTGMYIDITQVSTVADKHAALLRDLPGYSKGLRQELFRLLAQQRLSLDGLVADDSAAGTVVACRNHHFYPLGELLALERRRFEGEPAWVPAARADVLDREFPRRQTAWRHEGYTWRSELALWVADRRCGRHALDRGGASCARDRFVAVMRAMLVEEEGGEEERPVLPDWEAVAAAEFETAEIGSSRRGEIAEKTRKDAQL